ncbi:MAG: biopolymer transporter ExbD [Bdellovibrionales bacterium]|nr:biopolymer transporter ExbD [Bdellovibrionales bacterium]
MRSVLKRYRVREVHTELNLTAMVDMFTIILVFLVMSTSTSNVQVAPVDGLTLPASTISKEPDEALKLVVTAKALYVDDEKIMDINEGVFDKSQTDAKDKNFIRPLYDELEKHAKKAEEIQKSNPELKFTGQYILQADQSLNYSTIKKVIYTSMLAGYADLKMGAAGK